MTAFEALYASKIHKLQAKEILRLKSQKKKFKINSKLSNQLIDYFHNNPDKRPTIAELAVLFDSSISGVNWCLMNMLDHGIVQKEYRSFVKNGRKDMRYVYFI